MANIQERVENLTGGNSSSSSLPVAIDVATSFLTAVVKSGGGYNTPVQDNVDVEDKPLAVLSKAAYVNYKTGDTKETQKMIDDYNIGYKVVEDLTDPEYVTAINEEQQKIVVAFRGTDSTLTNITDDIADLEIAAGLAETPILSYVPSRFRTGENVYKQVKEQYPDYEISLTGHSLGGTVARYIGDRYSEKAVVFSAGATPLEPLIEKKLGTKPSTAKFYFTDTFDLLSNTSKFTEKNIRIVKTKEVNKKYFTGSHDPSNYLEPVTQKATFIKGNTKLLNKMYPQKIKHGIEGVRSPMSAVNPFEKSICELRPELCYD